MESQKSKLSYSKKKNLKRWQTLDSSNRIFQIILQFKMENKENVNLFRTGTFIHCCISRV